MFEGILNYCVLWIFGHVVRCPEWYNDVCFGEFYDENTKTFCRGLALVDNFYDELYSSDVSEHIDVSEHVSS